MPPEEEVSRSGVIACYGDYHGHYDKCRKCGYAKYCQEATHDDAAIANDRANAVDLAGMEGLEERSMVLAVPAPRPARRRQPEFTRDDLLEVISFMVCMDADTLAVLDAKINDPSVSFAELARQRKVSRQAMHKLIVRKCEEVPELASILHNRQNKLRQGGTNSFMEAVWEIRQQTSGRKLKKPNDGSKSSGTLMSLTRNLDLSRLSIFSGVRNYISD